ncbi:MAG: GAF domain-containing protein, partial [Anaerolineae bacterium]|nr:GAF domain-containing protein [Anaerolineae bacterium]
MTMLRGNPQTGIQQRVSRRVLPLIVLAFALIGLFGMWSIRSNAYENIRAAHQLILGDTADRVAEELAHIADDVASIAGEDVVRQFASEGSETSTLGLRGNALRRLLNWMGTHPDGYISLRYIDSRGRVQAEVSNTARGSEMVDTVGITAPESLYAAALKIPVGQAIFISPYTYEALTGETALPRFYFTTPVFPVGNESTPVGVLQLEVSVQNALGTIMDSEASELTDVEGRRLLVLNNNNQYLADSAADNLTALFVNITGAGREFSPASGGRTGRSGQDLDQFLQQNPGDQSTAGLGNLLISTLTQEFFPAPDMPWRVVLVDDANQVLGSSNFQSVVVLGVSIVVGLGAALGLLSLLRHELSPIARASTLAQQLAFGEAPLTYQAEAGEDALTQAVMRMSERVKEAAAQTDQQRARMTGNLQIATRISREAAVQNDLGTLLNQVVDLIYAEYQFYHVQVFLLDDIEENAVLAASHGEAGAALLYQRLKVPVRSASAISSTIETRRAQLDSDLSADRSLGAVLPGTQSRLVLPLFAQGRVIGVLDIQSAERDAFREDELHAYELLADQIGLAMSNIQLMTQSGERIQQIDALNREQTRTDWQDVEDKFQIEPAYHYDLRDVRPGAEPSAEALSMPIAIRGHVIGSLDVAMPEAGATFTTDEQLILRAVTDRVALAIDRARLFQETQLNLSETSLLYQLSRHINEATRLEEIIEAMIVSIMPGAIGGQVMEFDEYDPAVGPAWLTVTADWYDPAHQVTQDTLMGLRLHSQDHHFSAGLSAAEVLLIGDLGADSNIDNYLMTLLKSIGAQAMVVIPLSMRNLWRGLIAIEFPQPRRFTPQDRRIYTALIDQAGVAIDNSLLLRQTASALEETRRLYAASRSISSAPNLTLVYAAAVEHVAEASPAANQIMILLAAPERTPDAPFVEYGYVWRWGTDDRNLMGQRVARESLPYAHLAHQQTGVVLVRDTHRDLADQPEINQMLQSDGVSGVIISPLRSRQKWFGMLVCASDQVDVFDEQYAQFVQTIGDQIAIAIENYDLIAVAQSERETLRSILESMPSGVLVLDAKTYVPLNTNMQTELMLGQPIRMDQPFSTAYYNLYRTGTELPYTDEELPIFMAAQVGDLAFADDLVAVHEDGTEIDLLLNAAPIHDPDGSISMIVAAFENISSLRGLENALQDNLRETIALYEATRALAEADDVQNVLDAMVAQLAVLEPYEAAIVLADETSGQRSVARTLMMLPEEFALPPEVLTNQAVWISAVAAETELSATVRDDLLAHGIQAIGTMPLHIRTREFPLGWLIVIYDAPHVFEAEDERYMITLADSAATTLDNRYLFLRTESALQEASVLYQASRSLFASSNPEDILRIAVEHLAQEQTTQMFIALVSMNTWDSPETTATIVSNWNADPSGIDLNGITLTVEQFPAWRLLASPELRVVEDVTADPNLSDIEKMGVESLGVQSVVILPLRAANRAIGAIWIGSALPAHYSERERRIFQSFAEQSSISLEAMHLYEQAERRAGQLQTSAQVSRFASSILDLDILLPRLVDLIKSAFNYDHVQIFLMDREDRYAVLRASTGEAGRQLLAIHHRLEKGSTSVIGKVTDRSEPVIALDTGLADTVHRPNPYLPHTRSEMALPLIIKDRVVGALDVQSNQANAFTQEDVAVLTTLAAQISVAIDNARLFEQSERRASDMSLLFDVTTAAASAESLSDALQNVAEDLRESLNALSIGTFLPVEYLDEITGAVLVTMRAAAVAGYNQPLSSIPEIRVGAPDNLIGVVAHSRRARIIHQIDEESLYTPLVPAAQSAVIVPLASAGKIVGLISMENARPFAYNQETLTLLQTMGGTLTALIQNQQLLEQLQKTNEQLLEIDRLKSEFLANMSHELRTPLNSIIGFSRVILKGIDGPLTEMQEQDLSTIYNSGQHLLNLINDLLDQAKIAAGKMEIKPDLFDIKLVVEGVRSIGIGLVKDKPIEIKLDIASGLPQVYGDEFRTRQVLLNLLSNASKFTQQGLITVRVYRDVHTKTGQNVVRVDVVDTGIGIAEKDIPLLFEAFRQVDSSLTRTAGGTGLGLPISKSLIELQGGEMFVQSNVGAGSTFSVTIPLEPEEDHTGDTGPLKALVAVSEEDDTVDLAKGTNGSSNGAKATAPEKTDKRQTSLFSAMTTPKRQVLVIEDNPDRVDQFRRILQRQGFDIFAASIPLEAEAMASGLRPSVIIMDVNFANGAGWDIMRKLK